MSALMRDWIRPAVCKQLDEALQGTAQGGKASSSYSEDGTLMIHTTKGRAVQVNEFMSHAPPYLVLVSDSYTQIRAVFTKSSTDAFQRKYKQPFSRGTNGAVLGITDYYLSPPSQRVMLRIEGFALQGSEGSGNFGRPVPVEDSEVVTKLLSRLGKSFINGDLGPTSLIQSQASLSADDTYSLKDSTQAGFSTQVPTKVLNGATSPRRTDSAALNQGLLALLSCSKGQRASIRNPNPLIISESPYAPKPCEDHVNGGSDSVLPSSVSGQYRMMPSASTVRPIEPLTGSTKKRINLHGDVPLLQATSKSDILRSPRFGRARDGGENSVLLSRDISTGGRIENRIGAREDDDIPRRYNGAISKPRQTPYNISRLLHDANNPWEGLTRIPRKYVQVPKDQRDVLERDDAWHPQTPGRRQQGIILPPRVLMELQAFHAGLDDGEDNEQPDSDSDNDNDGQSNNQSDSYGEQGESRNRHSVQKTGRRSVDSERVSPSRAVSSDRDNFTGKLASSGPVSSDQGGSSSEDSLELAEMNLEDEKCITNTEGSYVQIDKILPNGKISLDKQVDVSSASLDHGNESSVEETMSWASSPDRVEVHSSRNHSLQEELQGSADDDRSTSPNSFQSQVPLGIISPVTLIDAESPPLGEYDRDSEVESLSVLNNNVQKRPTGVIERTTRALNTGLENSVGIFSSSPIEMELSVPYALGSENQPLDDVHMTDIFNEAKPVRSTREQLYLKLNHEGAPLVYTGSRSLHGKSHNVKADENTKRRQEITNISSDLIIPGTFKSEASNIFTNPREHVSAKYQTTLEGCPLEAGQVISDTPGHPARLCSDASSSTDGEKCLAQRQKLAQSEMTTQKGREIRSGKGKSLSVDNASRVPVDRQQFGTASNIEIPISATIHECSRPPVMESQVSFSKSLPPPHSPMEGETIPSTIAMPTKRRVSLMKDMVEHSAKRRRTLQTVTFNSAPEKDSAIDPTEMAKANRRKFLQELSLSSPIQSPHNPREDITARFIVTYEATAKTLFENTTNESIIALSDSNSPTCLPVETETPSVDLEKNSAQNSQDSSLYHSGHNEDTIDDESSEGKRNTDLNMQKQNIGLQQGAVPKTRNGDSAESPRHGQDNGSHTAVKVHPGDEHPSKNENIFDAFNRAYPSYGKTLRSFIRPCVYLDWLHSTKNPLHPSLWDDFIRAFSSEYLDYIKECEESEGNPMRAPEFYNNHVSEPIFKKRIMTPAMLKEAFLLDPMETAKIHSKIHQKKHRKSQESTSTASSQMSITSETLAPSQGTPIALHGKLYSTQQLPALPAPPMAMSHEISDNANDNEIASSQVLHTVSAPDSIISLKRAFFETPSQLTTQGRHKKSSEFNTFIPGKGDRSNAVIEGLPDVETVQANMIKQNSRRLPWSSSPHEYMESREPMETNGIIPEHSDVRSQSPSSRQSPPVSPLRQREESPVSGSMTSNSKPTAKQTLQSKTSSNLSSDLSFPQDLIFKTPNQPASKSLGPGRTSMGGPGKNNLHDRRTSQRDVSPQSLRMAKGQKPIISTSTATFKDFSKAFVPRQKRRSSGLSRVFTSGSDPSPSRIVASGSENMVEPDTQAWRF